MSETSRGLRIGRVRGVNTTKWSRIWGERYADPLTIIGVEESEQLTGLREGGLDLCFVRLPIDRGGLHAIPLYEEQMVAWVSKEHPICAVEEVSTADLEDEQVITMLNATATDLVLGGAVLVVPMSIARGASRRDLAYRPIVDAEPSPIAVAWRVDDENPLIQEFIGVVRGRTPNSSRAGASPNSSRASLAPGAARSPGDPRSAGEKRQRAGRPRRPTQAGGRGSKRRNR